jgi:hypothetical protein
MHSTRWSNHFSHYLRLFWGAPQTSIHKRARIGANTGGATVDAACEATRRNAANSLEVGEELAEELNGWKRFTIGDLSGLTAEELHNVGMTVQWRR